MPHCRTFRSVHRCLVTTACALAAAAAMGQDSPPVQQIPTQPAAPDKLIIEDITLGDGAAVERGCWAVVHYTGRLMDGTQFDSSRDPGREPFELFLPGQVIEGWNEGLIGLKKGGIRKLTIPPAMAYGSRGAPPKIPPNATLMFEIECLDVQCGPEIRLSSGLECKTTKPGDGANADFGTWVAFHAVVKNSDTGDVLFDTHQNTNGRPLESMLPLLPSRELPPHLGAFIYGMKRGEVRAVLLPNPSGNLAYELECVRHYSGQSFTLENGLKIEDIKVGEGDMCVAGTLVSVRYTGKLIDGTVFDSNTEQGEPPFETTIPGRVIPGWNLGLQGMREGGTRRLTVPADLAYGDGPPPGSPIKPGDTLVFDIELLDVSKPRR